MIIIDECHRSIYGLWRQSWSTSTPPDWADRTPTKQTFGFFRQNLVVEYSHDMAVIDRVNVDFTVYKIETAITEAVSTIEAGEFAEYRDRQTSHRVLAAWGPPRNWGRAGGHGPALLATGVLPVRLPAP